MVCALELPLCAFSLDVLQTRQSSFLFFKIVTGLLDPCALKSMYVGWHLALSHFDPQVISIGRVLRILLTYVDMVESGLSFARPDSHDST
jgi:hypothetical protein